MTPYMLLDNIAQIADNIMTGLSLKCGRPVKVYRQLAPMCQTEDGEKDIFPYCLIKLVDGQDEDFSPVQDVVLIFAAYDDSPDFCGYIDVLNMIWRTREYFRRFPYLGAFVVNKKMLWSFPDDEKQYPYYFGALLLHVELPDMDLVSENI